jgi:hypothetical protein
LTAQRRRIFSLPSWSIFFFIHIFIHVFLFLFISVF